VGTVVTAGVAKPKVKPPVMAGVASGATALVAGAAPPVPPAGTPNEKPANMVLVLVLGAEDCGALLPPPPAPAPVPPKPKVKAGAAPAAGAGAEVAAREPALAGLGASQHGQVSRLLFVCCVRHTLHCQPVAA
jgi:hypothetical protein